MSASERKIAELEDEVHKLRHLLSEQMRTGETLEVSAIVNREGTPLVDLRWDQLGMQISTDEGRDLALQILRVCEWADTDAIMLKALREKLEFDDREAAGFLAMMREARGGNRDRAG
jgi:hypothetical protein